MSALVADGLAANALVLLAVGYAVLYALGLARGRRALRLLGLAYLVGWAALGAALSYLLMLGIDPDVTAVLATAAVILAACTVAGRLSPAVPARAAPEAPTANVAVARLAVVLAAALLAVAGVAALVISLRSTWKFDYDVETFWLPKAEVLYYHHGLFLGPGGWQAFLHPEYPPLVPAMDAAVFGFAGGFHPSLLTFQQTLLGFAFLGSLLVLLGRWVPHWLSLPCLALLTLAPGFFHRFPSLLPDQTLAYLVALGVVACVLWLRERRAAWLALSVLLLAAATLTKLEGSEYAFLTALVVCGGGAVRRQRLALPAALLFLGAAAIEPWHVWLERNGLPSSATDYQVSNLFHPLFLAHRVGRLPHALVGELAALFRPSEWLPILPLVLLALVLLARRIPLFTAAAAVWLGGAFLGLIFIYWIGVAPVGLYVAETAHRLTGTIIIVAAAVLPLMLALALERPPPRASG